ncbi:Anoctamin-1 [Pseudolycoriella hygida]|uniref:Anoctamin n=1 Tax=Pseudolycoriella hygida TaxID=35572 RepID=A0A9Q0RZK3_9DIPT|nr:Anoctamin-1 [Pseudolycoriella hygida]
MDVRQHEDSELDSEMDDRDSIYLDTISLASEYPNRKSMSLSRQTIYHSAEDIQGSAATDANTLFKRNEQLDGLAAGQMAFGKYGQNDETWRRFQDGERTVDFVLAYAADDPHPRNADKRKAFESNLQNEGLELEREETQKIHFVKIHAPTKVLCSYCEILKIKMPIKRVPEQDDINVPEFQLMQRMKSFFGRPFDFVKLDPTLFPEKEYKLTHSYSRNYKYLFDVDSPDFFSQSTSIAVVQFILERQRFSDDDDSQNNVGIEKLLSDGVYQASYPLHDGDCSIPGSQRSLLFNEWAAVNKWIKHQPLDNIKEYFGVKIALYFAWLGFYTHMLIPASVVGLLCFLYGLITLFSNRISKDICYSKNATLMCPQCDEQCDYWYLGSTCVYSYITYLFDNNMTVVFASFMSFWAVLYLELWKRYSAKLIHRWGLADFSHQAEHPRPQYLSRLRNIENKKFNVVHRVLEPHVPFWKVKFPMYVMSFSVIFLFIFLAFAVVFGITIYRMSLIYSRKFYGHSDNISYQIVFLPATTAVLNLIIITALNYVYDYLAVYLTNLEYRRTQTEYDESLTLKIYLFQFVNYYSSIFYIAYLKGKFVGYPAKYNRIFGFRQEECSPGGCLLELCIQLVIIMVGKQALNAIVEMLIPFLIKSFNTVRNKMYKTDTGDGTVQLISCNQWTNDYKLLAWSPRGLFDDYLEMIIQYGFVTLFVVAFPLAPLFALLNNVFEMRLDAKKFLKYYRRPVPTRVKDIGVWFNIMSILGRIAVVSSAFIIAFSSNFIPRMVYMMRVNENHTDEGYLEHSLAYFRTIDFQNGTAPLKSAFFNVTECRYSEYRNHPDSDAPYKRPAIYWHILAARLAFFVVFQNVVGFVQMIVAWAIPDVPRKLSDQIKREEYLTREIIIDHELQRAVAAREREQSPNFTRNMGNSLRLRKANGENTANTELFNIFFFE